MNNRCHADFTRVGVLAGLGDELLYHARERIAVRLVTRCQITHQLRVQITGLAGHRMNATIGGEVGIDGHQFSLQRDSSHYAEEEGLTRAVLSNYQAKRRAPFYYTIDIL